MTFLSFLDSFLFFAHLFVCFSFDAVDFIAFLLLFMINFRTNDTHTEHLKQLEDEMEVQTLKTEQRVRDEVRIGIRTWDLVPQHIFVIQLREIMCFTLYKHSIRVYIHSSLQSQMGSGRFWPSYRRLEPTSLLSDPIHNFYTGET